MKVKIGQEEVELSPDVLKFTEATLSEYLMKDASIYSYYASQWVEGQYYLSYFEDKYEFLFSRKMRENKEAGATDKLAEAMAKSDPEIVDLKEKIRAAKRAKDHVWVYMKALEKNHENALNLGYNVRKEISLHGKSHVKTLDEIIN